MRKNHKITHFVPLHRLKSRSNDHVRWMRRALALAARGRGKTLPNPCVGAVLVKQGRIIGEGWHQMAGMPHAEIEAIQNAKDRGLNAQGSTLYVTLEPCCTWGQTPPCTKALLQEGIRSVVIGAIDPNPRHQGKGLKNLQKNGVQVMEGILKEECEALNRGWNYWIVHRTPWVIVKCGMTLDGKIATARGESQWITSEESRREGRLLRTQVDAVLVGVNTVLKDDSQLTIRRRGFQGKQPLRVILDTQARTPLNSRVLKNVSHQSEALIFVGSDASAGKVQSLQKAGAEVVSISSRGKERIRKVLEVLGKRGITSLLVEGGGEILGSFFYEKRVHEVVFFIAPKILGGRENIRAVAGVGFPEWRKSLALENLQVQKIGPDLRVSGMVLYDSQR